MVGIEKRVASGNVLATDLDGTLIPLEGDDQNTADLRTLAAQLATRRIPLVFVTGRHVESVTRAIDQYALPQPDWIICDVGTSIFERHASGAMAAVKAYEQHLAHRIAAYPISELRKQLSTIRELRPQEEEKQGAFKLSFYAEAADMQRLVDAIQQCVDRDNAPYSIVHSVDPFNGDGLIDLLPAGVSKAHALAWWSEHAQVAIHSLVFAGDSGNDLAALTAGYRAIVVGNADPSLAQAVDACHRASEWNDRLYLAQAKATSGVLEGCQWFGMFDEP